MLNYDGNGPLRTGPRTGRRLGRYGRRDDRTRSLEDRYSEQGSGWYDRPADGGPRRALGPRRKPTEDPADSGATARQQESFRRGYIEGLLTEELDSLKHTLSEYLRGDADELSAEVDGLKRLVSECLRGDTKNEE